MASHYTIDMESQFGVFLFIYIFTFDPAASLRALQQEEECVKSWWMNVVNIIVEIVRMATGSSPLQYKQKIMSDSVTELQLWIDVVSEKDRAVSSAGFPPGLSYGHKKT